MNLGDRRMQRKHSVMLYYAAVFLVIAIIAGVFGFGGIAMAKIVFFIFLVLSWPVSSSVSRDERKRFHSVDKRLKHLRRKGSARILFFLVLQIYPDVPAIGRRIDQGSAGPEAISALARLMYASEQISVAGERIKPFMDDMA